MQEIILNAIFINLVRANIMPKEYSILLMTIHNVLSLLKKIKGSIKSIPAKNSINIFIKLLSFISYLTAAARICLSAFYSSNVQV